MNFPVAPGSLITSDLSLVLAKSDEFWTKQHFGVLIRLCFSTRVERALAHICALIPFTNIVWLAGLVRGVARPLTTSLNDSRAMQSSRRPAAPVGGPAEWPTSCAPPARSAASATCAANPVVFRVMRLSLKPSRRSLPPPSIGSCLFLHLFLRLDSVHHQLLVVRCLLCAIRPEYVGT